MNYLIPSKKTTPIGCKLVFEKWLDKEGNEFISINLVYQSTEQLRNLEMLDKENSPMVYQLQLKGLDLNSDGLYSFKDVCTRFEKCHHCL